MLNFSDIQLFIRVSETGGISAAARSLGLMPATASAAIKRLERQLGSQLFERSTRSLRLTQAGEDFLGYCVQSSQLLEEGMAALKHGREGLSGEIHLGAPSDLGRDRLDEVLEQFRQRHPQIRLVMHLSDGIHDLYRNPIDLVLRYGLLRDSNLIAKKLCDNNRVICAAPAYVARVGRPENVEALAHHNCICFYRNGELFNLWRLFYQGQPREVQVSGDRAADDGALVRKWTLQGFGIAYKSRLDIQSDLAAGRLIDLFPEARCEQVPLYAVYPSRQYQPARLKALLQFLQENTSMNSP
ncbi:LysR family transcriptional regulator [Sulfuriferula plumbiphila]|uniref:LysR family transcriptional regulator n=1 Tax=Sulfuriferula plumbiphila TaxID=171865 RepID=A0A512L6G1_9PROT|nr:LysR family transcriptional regulator [Sulfuriferula plumbiphila]BBP04800.1 LysR family transcriptional regulator [Sulfuriferula plumbiphila]GEP30073.1 LysR family transcriptional regulator [Sulfuriferula plumbiphila]